MQKRPCHLESIGATTIGLDAIARGDQRRHGKDDIAVCFNGMADHVCQDLLGVDISSTSTLPKVVSEA